MEIGDTITQFDEKYLIVAILKDRETVYEVTRRLLELCDVNRGAYYPYTNEEFNEYLVLYKEW